MLNIFNLWNQPAGWDTTPHFSVQAIVATVVTGRCLFFGGR